MYSYISGTLKGKLTVAAVVDNGGIGYRINTTNRAMSGLNIGSEVLFYTFLHVREDILALYGFPEAEGVALFELLLSVSGIGPKAALAICELGSPAQVYGAVVAKDITWLTRAQGVGKRTAERLVLELKEKIGKDFSMTEPGGVAVSGSLGDMAAQAVTALEGLGYRAGETEPLVAQAIALLGPNTNLEAVLRAVLRNIAQGR